MKKTILALAIIGVTAKAVAKFIQEKSNQRPILGQGKQVNYPNCEYPKMSSDKNFR